MHNQMEHKMNLHYVKKADLTEGEGSMGGEEGELPLEKGETRIEGICHYYNIDINH